jgi:hypothetical protein
LSNLYYAIMKSDEEIETEYVEVKNESGQKYLLPILKAESGFCSIDEIHFQVKQIIYTKEKEN